MLSDEVLENLAERLVERTNKANENILKIIAKNIKKIGTMKISDVQRLGQLLKYGGDYDNIVKELARLTQTNEKEIYQIFDEVAKQDYEYAEQFYKYRDIKYRPWEENIELQKQVRAIAKQTADQYLNLSNTRMLGYKMLDSQGNPVFKPMQEAYTSLIDEAILSVSQGKETFNSAMFRQLKEIGSGNMKVYYENGYARRLDSSIRMNLKDGLRQLHNETQQLFGEEFGADGVEISVHTNPAPDHEEVQGRQFSLEEFEKFQTDVDAVDYKGKLFPAEYDGRDRRSISEYNCYHYIFNIILGVNDPLYTDEELKNIIANNNAGFEFEGRKYTNYEGTQLQRQIETSIRDMKNTQILARESGNEELAQYAQKRIDLLTSKYNQLNKVSGLPSKKDRMRVSGYHKIKLGNKVPVEPKKKSLEFTLEEPKPTKIFDFYEQKEKMREKGIRVYDDVQDLDKDLVERNLIHLEKLNDKYEVTDVQYLKLSNTPAKTKNIGQCYYGDNKIELNPKYFKGGNLIPVEKRAQDYKWHNKVREEDLDLYTITHEFGHAVENNYARKYMKRTYNIDTTQRREYWTRKEQNLREEIDKDIRDMLFKKIQSHEKISVTEIKNKYFSGYGNSKRHYEWFAETFAQMELGDQTPLTIALKEWLDENYY